VVLTQAGGRGMMTSFLCLRASSVLYLYGGLYGELYGSGCNNKVLSPAAVFAHCDALALGMAAQVSRRWRAVATGAAPRWRALARARWGNIGLGSDVMPMDVPMDVSLFHPPVIGAGEPDDPPGEPAERQRHAWRSFGHRARQIGPARAAGGRAAVLPHPALL
jgi:hypothetical protein